MINDLIRTSADHDTIRANPTPSVIHQLDKNISTLSRDQLCIARNTVIARMNTFNRDAYKGLAIGSVLLKLIANPPVYQTNQHEADLLAEWDGRISHWKSVENLKDLAAHNDEIALREEIIEELINEGKARHVAANLTNTEAKMVAEGRRLGIL